MTDDRPPVERAARLEGSRFTSWLLYGFVAGGSRELPNAMFCPSRLFRAGGIQRPIELPHLETFPGAACYQPIEQPACKAAPLQGDGLTISPCSLGERSAFGADAQTSMVSALLVVSRLVVGAALDDCLWTSTKAFPLRTKAIPSALRMLRR
jgi:hypothetical protein